LRPSYVVYFETASALAASGPPLAATYPISSHYGGSAIFRHFKLESATENTAYL
jgi:hypothetical protein